MHERPGKHKALSRQLVKQLLLLGVLLIICLTSIQAWLKYQARMTKIRTTIEQISQTETKGISNSLWEYNINWLQDQLRGILHFPYVNYIAVQDIENKRLIVEAGDKAERDIIAVEIPLFYSLGNNEVQRIGRLTLQLDTASALKEVWKDIILSFLFQIINVAIILVSLLILVKRLITRHLSDAADYFQHFDIESTSTPSLQLKKKRCEDEIDIMIDAFNGLRESLLRAYREQIKAQEKIKASEALFRVMVEKAPEAIIVYDTQYKKIVDANVKALHLFGCNRQTLLNSGLERFYLQTQPDKKNIAESMKLNISQALEGKEVVFERNILSEDGKKLICEVRLVKLPYGEHQWVRASYIDITERIKLIEEQKQMQRQLHQAQKAEALGVLAGGIAHDFNNILSAILGYTELSLIKVSEDSGVNEYLNKVLIASRRARDLVKQILAFSRQSEVDKIPLNLTPLVKESLKMLRATMPSTISIAEEYPQESCTILADPTQIHQVIMNLFTNAYHAMDEEGGKLSISMKTVSNESKIDISHLSPGRYVELAVTDNGCGMEHDIIEKIFDPYFTTKVVGKGTGLGLSITKGIVDSCGGGITVESVPGRGSIFRVYFPLVHQNIQAIIEHEEIPKGKGEILFVDDEKILMELGKNQIEQLGYSVTAVNSGTEALQVFTDAPEKFDVVITDQTMPEMTGVELAKRILQVRPVVPIILVTGYSHLVDEKLAKAMGIWEFAFKPLSRTTLARLIKRAVENKR